MAKIREFNDAHLAINAWANWVLTHIGMSNIGYPNRTAEGRAQHESIGIQQSGNFSSRCPEVMMPPQIAKVDHAVNRMPELLFKVIFCKYLPEYAERKWCGENRHRGQWMEAEKLALFRNIAGTSAADYYRIYDNARSWVASAI